MHHRTHPAAIRYPTGFLSLTSIDPNANNTIGKMQYPKTLAAWAMLMGCLPIRFSSRNAPNIPIRAIP